MLLLLPNSSGAWLLKNSTPMLQYTGEASELSSLQQFQPEMTTRQIAMVWRTGMRLDRIALMMVLSCLSLPNMRMILKVRNVRKGLRLGNDDRASCRMDSETITKSNKFQPSETKSHQKLAKKLMQSSTVKSTANASRSQNSG